VSSPSYNNSIRRLVAASPSKRLSSGLCLPSNPRHQLYHLAVAATGLSTSSRRRTAHQHLGYAPSSLRRRLPFLPHLSIAALHVMDAPFDTRSKRKHPSSSTSERPKKQLRADKDTSPPATTANGHDLNMASSQPNGDTNGGVAHDMEESKTLSRVQTAAETAEWQETIEKVVKKVVAIHFCMTCSFDTESALASEATGFVVDAERGYILTNRHVVGAGPFWGHCIFDNHEEVGVLN
jgi:hypothetical protein